MLQIHYFCCRNSLYEVLEKDDIWPEACLAALNRFRVPPVPRRRKDGLGLRSVPAHGHQPGHLWLRFSGALASSGWVSQGQEGLKEAPSSAVLARMPGQCRGEEVRGDGALPAKAPEWHLRDALSQS